MKPRDLYALPSIHVSNDFYPLEQHLPSVDFYRFKKSIDSSQRLRLCYYADHCYDGERNYTMFSVFFDGKPCMVCQNAGRGGRDHSEEFITDKEVYLSLVSFLVSLYEKDDEMCVFNPDEDIENLTYFYSRDLSEYYDPGLELKYQVGDVVMARVLKNHLNYSNEKILTRVRIDQVFPFCCAQSYRGTQLDRSVSLLDSPVQFLDTPDKGNLGCGLVDADIVELITKTSR